MRLFISAMRKLSPLILLAVICLTIPVINAEPSLSIELEPEPQFGQLWAYETYLVNMSVQDMNLSSIDISGFSGTPSGILFDGEIKWRGKGGYDFGEGTTGYSLNLDKISVSETVSLDANSAFFNLTLSKDAYDYGRLPFETIEIVFGFDAYVIMSDDTTGPKIASKSRTLTLVDEMKASYLEGKYLNMQDELNSVVVALGLEGFNREKYLGILEDMNNSLTLGNYVGALDIWDDYDEDDRVDMIKGLVRASSLQFTELTRLQIIVIQLEDQLLEIEDRLTITQLEYTQLENTYNALSSTYRKVNSDLEISRRNFSTAITAVFLTAILFYFLGRRGIRREEAERPDEPDIY